jgi:hypothetical protein
VGTDVTVPAFALGADDSVHSCTAPVGSRDGFPSFTCAGYPDGTSGAPFLRREGGLDEVVGVIGGLHQGGCTSTVSYSAPFTAATLRLLAQVESGLTPSVLPTRPSDGC